MALTKIQIKTGLNRENTNYAGEGGYYSCDKIRFRSGYAEKIGGWITNSVNTFAGVCRSIFNWVSLNSENLFAVGTNQRYYIQNNGTFFAITPIVRTLTLANNPFTTVAGTTTVTVVDAGFASTVGSFVNFTGATPVGGLTIAGSYEIVTAGVGTYKIYAPGATSGATAGGAAVVASYELSAGSPIYAALTNAGWGVSNWGNGGWGTSTGSSISIALWSQSNWGQDLVFGIRNGDLYYWVKNTVADAYGNYHPADSMHTYADTVLPAAGIYKTTTTAAVAQAAAVNPTIVVANTLDIDPGALLYGTNITAGTYVSTAWNGSTSVPLVGAVTGAGILLGATLNFSYAGKTSPNQINQVVVFSTYQFVVTLGSTPYDPTNFTPAFNPMLVRWSDQTKAYEWTPSTFNQSGEQILSNGSYIVAGATARQELLIWTDKALYAMQYVGAPFVFSFTTLMDNISIMSPNAMITVNNITYWMGVDKFYIYDGTVQPLPCTIRQYVLHNINFAQSFQVICGHNEEYSEVWWHYPSTDSNTNDSYAVWNYADSNWYFGTMNRTAWYDTPITPNPIAAISVQNSYLTAALTSTDTTIPVISCTSFPSSGIVRIDNEQIAYTTNNGSFFSGLTRGAGGSTATSHLIYSAVTYSIANQIVTHENGVDDGSVSPPIALPAYIETSDFDIQDGENFAFVSRIIPDLTFEGSTSGSNPRISLSLNPRQYPGYAYNTSAIMPVDSVQLPPAPPAVYPVEQYTGVVFCRIRGRQLSFRVASDKLGTTWQLGLMRFDVRPDGRR